MSPTPMSVLIQDGPLAPYPAYSPDQDRLVLKVERFCDRLTAIQQAVGRAFHKIGEAFARIGRALKLCRKETYNPVGSPASSAQKAPEVTRVAISNGKQCLDAKFYFAVRDGRIWFKPIASGDAGEWKLFGPHGGLPSEEPTEVTFISADGDNLVAVDSQGRLHYTKTHETKWSLTGDSTWEVREWNTSWTTKWFAMPIAAAIVNKRTDPCLRPFSKENFRTIAISQKGPDAAYYTDMSGKKHPEFLVGVTTLYGLSKDGTRIFFADPWLGNKFENEITGPEDGRFIADNMAAAGSTVFLLQRSYDKEGREINKMYTRFADFDSIGSNPLLPKTFDKNNRIPLVRYVPAEDWTQQTPIRLEGKARLCKAVTVLQTGRGQANRQLRVQGTNSEGEAGYYYKQIYDTEWEFEPTPNVQIPQEKFLPPSHLFRRTGFQQGPKRTESYQGTLSTRSKHLSVPVSVDGFMRQGLNERGLHTSVTIPLASGKQLRVPLLAYRGLAHLMGLRKHTPHWRLQIPSEYRQSDDPEVRQAVHRLFGKAASVRVKVQEGAGHISISSRRFRMRLAK